MMSHEDYQFPHLSYIFITKLELTATCSISYDWLATPLAPLYHSYCINEENLFLPSHSDLADEIEGLRIKD